MPAFQESIYAAERFISTAQRQLIDRLDQSYRLTSRHRCDYLAINGSNTIFAVIAVERQHEGGGVLVIQMRCQGDFLLPGWRFPGKTLREKADNIVLGFVASTTATGAVPIPFADAPMQIAQQVAMMAAICSWRCNFCWYNRRNYPRSR